MLSLSSLFSPSSSSATASTSTSSASSNSFAETSSYHDMTSFIPDYIVNASRSISTSVSAGESLSAEVVIMTECVLDSADETNELFSSSISETASVTAPSSSSKHSPSYTAADKSPSCHSTSTAADVDTEFVENSLLLYEHVSYIAHDIFKKHISFKKALKEGLNTFVNKDSTMVLPCSTSFEIMRGGSGCIDVEEERKQNQAFMRRNIRRFRKLETGIGRFRSEKYTKGYEKIRNDGDNSTFLGYSSSDSDSDLHDTSRSETSDSLLLPSKIPRHVSWESSYSMGTGTGAGTDERAVKSTDVIHLSPESIEYTAASSSSKVSVPLINGSAGKLSVPSFPSTTASTSSSSYVATTYPVAASQVVMLASYCDKLLKVS